MYRFLIIDDEPVVREGISETIDWAAHGFELVGACRDGREALDALEQLRPDVVLTDICMPFVDGLELAAWIGEQYPRTKTILLTGYDEFEYAQEAVKLKVSDFILKPITADELRSLLDTVKQELDEERNRQKQLERIQEQLKESLPVLQERFLNRLVRGPLTADELERKTALLELNLPGPVYSVLICDSDSRDQGDSDDYELLAIQEIARHGAAETGQAVTFSTPQDQIVVLVTAADGKQATAVALECSETISEAVERELGTTVSIGIGNPVSGMSRVPQSASEARMALEHRLSLGPNQIITVNQVRGANQESALPVNAETRGRFVQALRAGFAQEADRALHALMGDLRSAGRNKQACFREMHRLLADTLSSLESLGVDYADVDQLEENPFAQLGGLKTLEDMERWFSNLLHQVQQVLEERRQEHSKWKAVQAEEYIRANYMRPDLSLKVVCNALSISKSYLSHVFKVHTGMTIVEFLTDVRMERAKELLSGDDLKTYEVAEMVGFRDPHYFSLTFKKQVGASPTEYRDLVREAAQ